MEFINKPISDHSWIPLSDIPNNYNKIIKCFHHHHTSLPKPSPNAFKSKAWYLIANHPLSTSISTPTPSPSILPIHDPLAHVPCPMTPPDPNCFMYQTPSVTTTHSK